MLAYVELNADRSNAADSVFNAWLFLADLADSLFLALLLAIAGGFCISRETLAPHKGKIIAIPLIYFVTLLVVDYTVKSVGGRGSFHVNQAAVPLDETQLSEWRSALLAVCALVNLLALLGGWLCIFDVTSKELEQLQAPVREATHARDLEAGAAPAAGAAGNGQASEVGHPVGVQPDAAMLDPHAARSDDPQTLYTNAAGDDLAPKTAEDALAHRSKIRMMKHFGWAVGAYVLATVAAVIVPAFVTDDSTSGADALTSVLVIQNFVRWAFMAGLCWIFRLRPDNPYLLLDEEEGADRTGLGASSYLTTELGVLTAPDDDTDSAARASSPRTPVQRRRVYANSDGGDTPRSVDRHFSLGEDDDTEPVVRPSPAKPATSKPQSRLGARKLSNPGDLPRNT